MYTSDFNVAGNEIYMLWDEVMNEAYEVIMEQSPNTEGLKEEQNVWVTQLENEATEMEDPMYGTIAISEAYSHRLNETEARVRELVDTYMK